MILRTQLIGSNDRSIIRIFAGYSIIMECLPATAFPTKAFRQHHALRIRVSIPLATHMSDVYVANSPIATLDFRKAYCSNRAIDPYAQAKCM